MNHPSDPHITTTCEYSGLPGMAAYMQTEERTIDKAPALDAAAIDRIIEMAWEDRTPFEAIRMQFGIAEQEVIALMRKHMKPSSFRMWRKRVTGRKTKHVARRGQEVSRFRSQKQRLIG
jgi:uncharacterized protein (TIGR03643 family)